MQTRKQIISETVLNELYGLRGYLARVIDQSRIDRGEAPMYGDPKAERAGKNPYLTSTGKTTYPGSNAFTLDASAVFADNAGAAMSRDRQMVGDLLRQSEQAKNPRIRDARIREVIRKSMKHVRRFSPTGILGNFTRITGMMSGNK